VFAIVGRRLAVTLNYGRSRSIRPRPRARVNLEIPSGSPTRQAAWTAPQSHPTATG